MSAARLSCLLGAFWLASCTPTDDEQSAATAPTLEQIENATHVGNHDNPVPRRLRGHVTWGHEVRSFVPCESDVSHWVVDETSGDLPTLYESLASAPYQPIFVELEGVVGEALKDGFGADYDAALAVYRVWRAENEGRGCSDDLTGLRFLARGNEPLWMVEIREETIRLVEPGEPDRSWSVGLARNGSEIWHYASGADDANGLIEVAIREERCRDSMSGAYFGYVAEATLGDAMLTGCAARGIE